MAILEAVFADKPGQTPQEVERRRRMAQALIESGAGGKAPSSGLELAGRLAMTLTGQYQAGQAEKQDASNRSSANKALIDAVFGGSQSAPSFNSQVAATSPSVPSASSAPAPVNISGSKQEFVNALLPAAIEEGKRTGVDPRIIVAQAAQETGWGKSAPGNNFFGIKSHGKGGGQSLNTHEYVNGKRVNVRDSFRTFGSPGESVRGYGDFILQNPRYKSLREAQGLDAQLAALQASGYATDPNYSSSVGAIARGIQLPQEVASLDPSSGMPLQTAAGAVNAMAAGGSAVLADETKFSPEDRERLAALRGSAPSAIPYSGPGARIDTPMAVYDDKGFRMEPASQQPRQTIPAEFAGSQQLANAQGGIIPALMGGSPASPEQIAQARALGAQQPQPQPQGQDNRALIATLLGNPYTAEAGQQLLMQEMQRRQEASDPMRQMEMEKQRLELDAMRNPQVDPLKVGEGETVIDPRTGQVVYQGQPKEPPKPSAVQEYEYAKEQGFPGTFQDWEASKKGGMSLQVDPATGAVSFQQGGNIKPMTEAQSKDAVFSTRAAGALPLIDQFGDALTGMEGALGGTVGQLPVVGNFAKTEAFQQAEQAGKEFLQAILRKDTGAAITSEETAEYGSVYLPRPGDSPQLLQQKKASRLRALEAIKAGMPPQAILAQEKALAKTQQGSAPRQPIVIDGYTIEEVE